MKRALEAFAKAFTAEDTIQDLAPAMTGGEAEIVADLLDELGETDAATLWRSLADNDSEVEA